MILCHIDTGILLPKFRWHRSRWGRFCPVELANGNMVPGRMEFAVGYVPVCVMIVWLLKLQQLTCCESNI